MLKPLSRSFQDGDEEQVVELYNKITGRNRTVPQHQWEWLHPPEGRGMMWVIEDETTKKIIGHHGLIPVRIVYQGKSYRLGKTENTIIHPKLLGNGLYFLYEKKFFSESSEQFDLLATTAGDGAPGKIRKRLNYKPVSHYEIYFTLCNAAHVKKNVQKRLSGKKVNKLLNFTLSNIAGLLTCLSYPFFSAKKVTHKKIELSYITSINELRNELDRFWEDNKACFGITIDRSSHFLQWRIFENPNINYTFIAAKQEETLVGYIILKKTHGRLDYGVIEDIVAKDLSIDIYLSLLQEAKNYCNKEHYAAIIFPTLSSNSRLKNIFKKGGYSSDQFLLKRLRSMFKKAPKNTEFLINKLQCPIDDNDLYDASKWYFTGLFFEGIH